MKRHAAFAACTLLLLQSAGGVRDKSEVLMREQRPVGGRAYSENMSNLPENNTDNPDNGAAATGIEPPADQTDTIGGTRPDPSTAASKDPNEWVTGDEPMTGPQRSYLDTLAREAGEELPGNLNKAEASQHIDRLQGATGRGTQSAR